MRIVLRLVMVVLALKREGVFVVVSVSGRPTTSREKLTEKENKTYYINLIEAIIRGGRRRRRRGQ